MTFCAHDTSTNRFIFHYRVQADHLPAIAPILETLIERAEKSVQPKIRLLNSTPLPISALIALVDAHYKSYQSVQAIRVSPSPMQISNACILSD